MITTVRSATKPKSRVVHRAALALADGDTALAGSPRSPCHRPGFFCTRDFRFDPCRNMLIEFRGFGHNSVSKAAAYYWLPFATGG